MKKYNGWIVISLLGYVFIALLLGYGVYHQESTISKSYQVEISRAMNVLQDLSDPAQLNMEKYPNIQEICFVEKSEQDLKILADFYEEDAEDGILIQPWYQDGQVKGYLKFRYVRASISIDKLLVYMEAGLLVMELFVLGVLCYLRQSVVLPFQRLSEMPAEFAKGHVKKDVVIEKSRFFQSFLLGMGQMKDELELSKKRQLQLLKEKKQLLLSLSHDIKTPLNLIRLYGRALDENLYEDEISRKRAISKIEEKAVEIEDYVNQIMQASREDILDIEVIQGEFYLSELLEKVLDVYEEQCSIRHIQLLIDPYENRLLKGDIERSREVFDNLFENAFKYGDGRSIQITCYEEDYCQLIRFYNTGNVINDNECNHLFDSFFRGTNALGKAGSGLGLYICQEIMQKMDGAIFVQREKDGMAFVLVFR